jgi:hypothetical protein
MRVWPLLVVTSGLAAADPAPASDPGAALEVHLRVHARSGRTTTDVAPGDTLHTNDFLELLVSTNAKAYLYVVQTFPDGTSAVLFPETGDFVIEANAQTRVPSAGSDWFQLDENTGTEQISVIASRQPIAKADAAIDKEVHAIREASKPPDKVPATGAGKPATPPPAPKPEKIFAAGRRGLKKVTTHDGATTLEVSASSKSDGYVVAQFAFKHDK